MQIQLIRSATLKVTLAGQTFLIDPWLAPKGEGKSYAGKERSPLAQLPMSFNELMLDVDAVIVSHLHSDHFDETARALLSPSIPIICHSRDVDALAAFGFCDVRGTSSHLVFGNVTIQTTDGQHGPPEVLAEMGDVSGFVFRASGEPRLYWVGDSIFCDAVRSVIADEVPYVIVVHACGAHWNGRGPLVMDASMVFDTINASKSAIVLARHLDSVDHATVSREDLVRFARTRPELAYRLAIPADGTTLVFTTPTTV